jgi:hypothetical protein
MIPPRIEPLTPPWDEETAAVLARWMPPGASSVPPLALFRTIARHPMLRDRMRPLGSGLLAHGHLPARVRELLILRSCARCGARYEWGVHVTAYSQTAGLGADVVTATALATPGAVAMAVDEDAIVMRLADELHDSATLSDASFELARARWGEDGVLEIAAVVGFYHLISFLLRVAGTPEEPWAAAFPA